MSEVYAFPVANMVSASPDTDLQLKQMARGMTLRDYFAAAAMMRMHAADKDGIMGPEITAQAAYRMADMMLAERAK